MTQKKNGYGRKRPPHSHSYYLLSDFEIDSSSLFNVCNSLFSANAFDSTNISLVFCFDELDLFGILVFLLEPTRISVDALSSLR